MNTAHTLAFIKHTCGTYLHKYGHYDQSIGALRSLCIICVKLMIVVDQLNLENTESTCKELLKENHTLLARQRFDSERHKVDLSIDSKKVETLE